MKAATGSVALAACQHVSQRRTYSLLELSKCHITFIFEAIEKQRPWAYLLDVLQSLDDSDVVQVNPPCSVPVLDGGAVFRDRQPLQELQQVVMVVVDDAVYRGIIQMIESINIIKLEKHTFFLQKQTLFYLTQIIFITRKT